MSIIKKRLFALLMTMVMALSLSVSAFAAEPVDITAANLADSVSEEATTRSLGDQLAFNATSISGGHGSLQVYLSSGKFWADIVAGIGYSSQSDPVICYVITPDGDELSLGTISGSGSTTIPYEVFYASAGTYTFHYYTTTSSTIEVFGGIYKH